MIVLEANVLLAAYRADHTHHPRARAWLEAALSSGQPILVPDFAWVGFVRLVTNTHIFEVPSTPTEAFEFIDAISSMPSYTGVPGLTDGITAFRDVALASDSWGNLTPDAYLASVAPAHAAPIASFDRDFHRFEGLEIVGPCRVSHTCGVTPPTQRAPTQRTPEQPDADHYPAGHRPGRCRKYWG